MDSFDYFVETGEVAIHREDWLLLSSHNTSSQPTASTGNYYPSTLPSSSRSNSFQLDNSAGPLEPISTAGYPSVDNLSYTGEQFGHQYSQQGLYYGESVAPLEGCYPSGLDPSEAGDHAFSASDVSATQGAAATGPWSMIVVQHRLEGVEQYLAAEHNQAHSHFDNNALRHCDQSSLARPDGRLVSRVSSGSSSNAGHHRPHSNRDSRLYYCQIPGCTYPKPFARSGDRDRHEKTHGSNRVFRCTLCNSKGTNAVHDRKDKVQKHFRQYHRRKAGEGEIVEDVRKLPSFRGYWDGLNVP